MIGRIRIELIASHRHFSHGGRQRRRHTVGHGEPCRGLERRQAADLADYRHNLIAARSQLDEAAWEAAWEAGQSMTTEQAIAYALEGSS